MAQYEAFANYVVFFRDDADYNFAISVAGGNNLKIAPVDAANLFGITYPTVGEMDNLDKGIYFLGSYTPGTQINNPNPSGVFLNDTILSVVVPGQVGNPLATWPKGPDLLLTWVANIVKSGGKTQASPPAIAQRRWLMGWEVSSGEGILTINTVRDASRIIDGHGMACRNNSGATVQETRFVNAYRALSTATSWERFYVRIRSLGSIDAPIWVCKNNGFANVAGMLQVTSAGTIGVYNVTIGGAKVLKGTISGLTLNKWYRIDVMIKFGVGPTDPARLNVYLNGVFKVGFVDASFEGMNNCATHDFSVIGKIDTANNELEFDIDDWINSDLPGNMNSTFLSFNDENFPMDWLLGSHVRNHFCNAASLGGWTGNKGTLNQVVSLCNPIDSLTNSTSGALLSGLTDAVTQDVSVQNTSGGVAIGAVSALISQLSSVATGATTGKLGYSLAGGSSVLTTVTQSGLSISSQVVAYLPSGMLTPNEISPFSVVKQKSTDGNLDTTQMLTATVEYLGIFGEEDDPDFQYPISRLTWLHNCRYANTQWGLVGSVPIAPVYAIGGTYTGNGSFQQFSLPIPCHFLWIRALTGATTIVSLFGASIGAHLGTSQSVISPIRMWMDDDGNAFFSVNGNIAEINATGVTYQYIAFCDPGMRFNISGGFQHGQSTLTAKTEPLIDATFTPQGGFIVQESAQLSNVNIAGFSYKGPGNSGNTGSQLSGTVVNNWGGFGPGTLTTLADNHVGVGQNTYSLWRPIETNCAGVMCQIYSYIGNGAGSRVINSTPASGRYPLFVLVIPANAAAFFRDPSHLSSNSSGMDLSNSTTAITAAGIDTITVGSTLNQNGVAYNVFIIPGDSAGFNNGIFYNPTCLAEGPWDEPNPLTGDINLLSEGGLVLDGTEPQAILKDISGIYTLITNKTNDSYIDRQTNQTTINVAIPDPTFKTGYIGG